MQITNNTQTRRLAWGLCALLGLAGGSACNNSSVVSDSGKPAAAASPVASPVAAASPVASLAASAAVSPTPLTVAAPPSAKPVPSGTTTMTTANASILAQNPNAGKRSENDPNIKTRGLGDFPLEVGPARIPTPTPDPFKPQPTPTVVMEGGKIKQQWQAPAEAAALTNPAKNRADVVKLGQELYLQRCSDCHGRSGKGNGGMSSQLKRDGQLIAPTNLTSQMVQANSDGELFWKITNGRSPMPASRARFTDDERWAIVAFLRTLK